MKMWVFVVCLLLSLGAILSAAVPLIIGKLRLKRAIRPIEYYPPRGYSPIDVMHKYYSYRMNAHAIINPLMLYWASRGFIEIEEDCKRGLNLTKLKELEPPDNIPSGEEGKAVRENYNGEKRLFDELFCGGDKFYTLAAPAQIKNVNKKFMENCKLNAKQTRSPKNDFFAAISLICAELALILTTLINVAAYDGGALYAIMLFPIIAILIEKSMPGGEPIEQMIKYPFVFIWGGVPSVVVFVFVPFYSAISLFIAVVAAVITIAISRFIDIRSYEDIAIYGRICAFKQFLLEAEADRLETLIEDNPHYWFDILPYCYVLKITEKLKPKFERIVLEGPSWYLGELRDTLMF